jgi:hypothetical protein
VSAVDDTAHNHDLAGRESVRIADLAGETMPRWRRAPEGDVDHRRVAQIRKRDAPQQGAQVTGPRLKIRCDRGA